MPLFGARIITLIECTAHNTSLELPWMSVRLSVQLEIEWNFSLFENAFIIFGFVSENFFVDGFSSEFSIFPFAVKNSEIPQK